MSEHTTTWTETRSRTSAADNKTVDEHIQDPQPPTDIDPPEDLDLDLSPTAELDEISQRTTADGYVEVKILRWEKTDSSVVVYTRHPNGSVLTTTMDWPEWDNPDNEFIQFIANTPYTLRTADQLNDDDDCWVLADPDNGWQFVATNRSTHDIEYNHFLESGQSMPWMLLKTLLFPVTFVTWLLELQGAWRNQHKVPMTQTEYQRVVGAVLGSLMLCVFVWFWAMVLALLSL